MGKKKGDDDFTFEILLDVRHNDERIRAEGKKITFTLRSGLAAIKVMGTSGWGDPERLDEGLMKLSFLGICNVISAGIEVVMEDILGATEGTGAAEDLDIAKFIGKGGEA